MFMPGVTIVLVLLNALAAAITPVANETDDIRIVALEPQGLVAAGVETEFRIGSRLLSNPRTTRKCTLASTLSRQGPTAWLPVDNSGAADSKSRLQ